MSSNTFRFKSISDAGISVFIGSRLGFLWSQGASKLTPNVIDFTSPRYLVGTTTASTHSPVRSTAETVGVCHCSGRQADTRLPAAVMMV
ncbi:hypothetical protein Plhal304r1_c048g0130561 [Plasmopara halstedii]